jgi:hypothetical protein
MAANVLNSARAVEMSVYVVRAFVKMRSVLAEHKELARELAELENKLTERLDAHELAIIDVLRRIMFLLDPPPPGRSEEASHRVSRWKAMTLPADSSSLATWFDKAVRAEITALETNGGTQNYAVVLEGS